MNDDALIKRLDDVNSVARLRQLCSEFVSAQGLSYFLYGARIPTSLAEPYHLTLSDFPAFWQRRYEEKGYIRSDPVVTHVISSLKPFFWDEIPLYAQNAKDFFRDAEDFGVGHGLTIPVYGRGCQIALFSAAHENPLPGSRIQRLKILRRTQWFAVQLHEVVQERLSCELGLPGRQDLLKTTEKECLLWAAEGLDTRQTEAKLQIPAASVNRHLARAMRKLDAGELPDAITRAVALGEISPPSYQTRRADDTPVINWFSGPPG